jgi:thiol-disulfide isomerase/thioredoxin
MKAISLLLVSFIILSASCKTTKPVAENKTNSAGQDTMLIGYFIPDRLISEPYSAWYIKGYDDYQFNTEAINKLFDIQKEGITIKIVMGTWCPDSRREVPHFMKVLDTWQFPAGGVIFIGVDRAKHSPAGEVTKLDIRQVPTFIIYKNNIEAGRIIETPTTSLEQDMVNILNRNE